MARTASIAVPMPEWLYKTLSRIKRSLSPKPAALPTIDINGERNIEWSFLSTEMPNGPGKAIEFGCENGYLSLLAGYKGFHVVANDLQEQYFPWKHPRVEFLAGDFLKLDLPANHFDLAINCSSVEHVGVAGRYGITVDTDDGDIQVMRRLANVLKPEGKLLMTAPCGQDAILAPWCRVYGAQRLPSILAPFDVLKETYWIKNDRNQWVESTRDSALGFQPRNDSTNPHLCAYALGCFVLRRKINGENGHTR